MFLFKDFIDIQLTKDYPTYLFVFGDNLEGWGKKGQAIIRDAPNAYGVPTKRKPSREKEAYFSDKDEEYKVTREALLYLYQAHKEGTNIVLPKNQLGSGLADLKTKSPRIAKMIDDFYQYAHKSMPT